MNNLNTILHFKTDVRAGFTLVETLVAVSIFSIMMLAVSSFFVNLYKEYFANEARLEGIGIVSRAIENMSSEMRKMNRAENGIFPIEDAQDQTLIFYSDVDNDSQTEKIKYYLDETDLKRDLIEPGVALDYSDSPVTTVVASSVINGENPIFRYYNANYTGTQDDLGNSPNVTLVRVIGITIDVNTKKSEGLETIHVETKISPRNLKNFN